MVLKKMVTEVQDKHAEAYQGHLAKGCELCITGEKSVFFVTGVCPRHCFYCPISEQKWQKDEIYINEWKTDDFNNIVKEIELCKSKGVGITGGDPLARVDRTAAFIKKLKEKFGKEFHIHLYTSLNLFTEENLKKLYDAGLDEIRCHPDIEDKKYWERIQNGTKFQWHFGMEIPAIPGKEKETIELINFAKQYVQFINLNELEYSDTNAAQFGDKYKTKNSLSYGIKGSEDLAKALLKEFKEDSVRIHYCSSAFKDNIQMRRRIKKRAESIMTVKEEMTEDGMIRKGIVYLKELVPGVGYKKKLEAVENKDELIQKLTAARNLLLEKKALTDIEIDEKKYRLLCPIREIRRKMCAKAVKDAGYVPAVVEEYPTADAFEVEIDFV